MSAQELTVRLGPSLDLSPPVGAAADGGTLIEPNAAALSRLARWRNRVRDAELTVVSAASRSARAPVPRSLAITVSWLGNGWIYPLLLAALVARFGTLSLRVALPAAVNAVLLHTIYPILKRIFRRQRPFQADPRLPSLLKVLDAHSFPSGHTMTLVGVLTPIVILWPAASFAAMALVVSMAWSRVATAHHYPSDVAAGAALGLGLGYPTTLVVSAWLG